MHGGAEIDVGRLVHSACVRRRSFGCGSLLRSAGCFEHCAERMVGAAADRVVASGCCTDEKDEIGGGGMNRPVGKAEPLTAKDALELIRFEERYPDIKKGGLYAKDDL